MDRDESGERPATTRIGPAGGPGRGFRALIVVMVVAVAVAVAKPWDWVAAPVVAPGREGAAIPAGSPAGGAMGGASSAPGPTPPAVWTGAGDRVACLSGGSWLAVVDAVNGPTTSRSWTRLDPVPAAGPTDPGIVRTHVYAEAVPRIGFCAPGAAEAGADGAASAAADAFEVRAWRVTTATAGDGEGEGDGDDARAGSDALAVTTIAPVVISGGALSDLGALFGPPLDRARGAAGQPRDPEAAWAARMPERAPWSPGVGAADAGSWPPGTYVFRVGAPGSARPGSDAAWFAIELRGPWLGPEESPAP